MTSQDLSTCVARQPTDNQSRSAEHDHGTLVFVWLLPWPVAKDQDDGTVLPRALRTVRAVDTATMIELLHETKPQAIELPATHLAPAGTHYVVPWPRRCAEGCVSVAMELRMNDGALIRSGLNRTLPIPRFQRLPEDAVHGGRSIG